MIGANSGDGKDFEKVLNRISDHPRWKYSESNTYSVDELAARLETGSGPGANYETEKTDGRLQVRTVGDPDTLLGGSLVQSLASFPMDPDETDNFPHRLGQAYSNIAAEYLHESPYLNESSPEANPVDVLRIEIPGEYDMEELDSALNLAEDASQEVQELLDEIDGSVEDRL